MASNAEPDTIAEELNQLQSSLTEQYLLAESLMNDYRNAESLQSTRKVIDDLFHSIKRLHDTRPGIIDAIELGRIRHNKLEFEDRVTKWFKYLYALPRRKPPSSRTASSGSKASSRSSHRRAEAKVKADLARLEIQQATERHQLEERLKADEQRMEIERRELARAREQIELEHRLQAAVLEEKAFEEDSDETEYLNLDETGSATPRPVDTVKREISSPKPSTGYREGVGGLSCPTTQKAANGDHVGKWLNDNPDVKQFTVKEPTIKREEECNPYPLVREKCHPSDIATLVRHMNRPKPEVVIFKGDPMNYWRFIRNFESHVDETVDTEEFKLSLLLQNCQGSAKRMIECCVRLNSSSCYEQARKILYDNFGKPHIIAHTCMRKVTDGPEIKANDSQGLQEFSQLLRDCVLTLSDIGQYSEMNNYPTLVKVVNRLPYKLQDGWRRRVADIYERTGHEPLFEHLVDFVDREDRIANSLFSKMMDEHKQDIKRGKQHHVRASTHAIAKVNESRPEKSQYVQKGSNKCPCCLKVHALHKCNEFQHMSTRDRLKLVWQKRLCYNCLKTDHNARTCKVDEACAIEGCTQKHHTLLHRDRVPPIKDNISEKQVQKSPDAAHDSAVCSVISPGINQCHAAGGKHSTYFCVVPVKVCANGESIETYAFLDSGSGVTLCTKRLIDTLGIKGESSQVTLNTVNGMSVCRDGLKVSLTIESLDGEVTEDLTDVYSVDELPMLLPIQPNAKLTRTELEQYPHLRDLHFPEVVGGEVSILIGTDVPWLLKVEEVSEGKRKQPIAFKMPLGWTLVGPSYHQSFESSFAVNFLQKSDDSLQESLERMWKTDFVEANGNQLPLSKEDKYVLDLLNKRKKFVDGHYQLPLPWHPNAPPLPDNRCMAESRLASLKRRLQRDNGLRKSYIETMEDYISKGYAGEVLKDREPCEGKSWFLPHHPVMNPHKPGKVRVVFDCAAKHHGRSLNESLLQGPDLANSLVGVLSRFREEEIAILADVEAMFHQIKVDPVDINVLKFLWWKDGNISSEPKVYRMLVHLFGAKSSPSCANFCLKQVAIDFKDGVDADVVEAIGRNFYVDDLLKSVPTVKEASRFIQQVTTVLGKGGFRLTKWLSNSEPVLAKIPEKERAKSVMNINLDGVTSERVLGVYWNVPADVFGFNIDVKYPKLFTRRNILSIVSSLYDPLGFASPVVVVAKIMQQELCRKALGWDDPISEDIANGWYRWLEQLPKLANVKLARCLTPMGFGKIRIIQLHHFSDASSAAYATVSYLRLVDDAGNIYCSFLIGRARVCPLKAHSIPRLELVSCVISVKHDKLIRKELTLAECQSVFWTDSTAVLQSIRNSNKRFPVFVGNRLSKIEEGSKVEQWRYVNTNLNPADDGSRGISVDKLVRSSKWLKAPDFLWKEEDHWPKSPLLPPLPEEFMPVKKQSRAVCLVVQVHSTDRLISRYSSLNSLKKSVAWLLRYKTYLRQKANNENVRVVTGSLTIDEMRRAETSVIKYIQEQHFPDVLQALTKVGNGVANVTFKKKDRRLHKLSPILVDGILRVGGRLDRAPIDFDAKHPIILPYDHHFTELIIMKHHDEVGHSGVGHTWVHLREKYWIIKGGVAVRKILGKCISCRKRNARVGQQLMADLPASRLQSNKPPFSFVGVDFFGPYLVKQGRSQVKRYACIFTCMSIRAVHIEIAQSLSTDSFIAVFRRFIGRRGKPEQVFSDNGTNFKSADRVLCEEIQRLNQQQINEYLRQREIVWNFNPPAASHMGGVWERLIRSVRKILKALLMEQTLTDEKLSTLMVEVESILNSRPITPLTFDPDDEVALTPNHLLLNRASPNFAPGIFVEKDCFSRNRWRQVQYMTDQFWRRWTKEYLPTLMQRQKWTEKRPNFTVGDVVLLADDLQTRSGWTMGRILETFPDKNGTVRQVSVKTRTGLLRRPITKLCLICRENATDN